MWGTWAPLLDGQKRVVGFASPRCILFHVQEFECKKVALTESSEEECTNPPRTGTQLLEVVITSASQPSNFVRSQLGVLFRPSCSLPSALIRPPWCLNHDPQRWKLYQNVPQKAGFPRSDFGEFMGLVGLGAWGRRADFLSRREIVMRIWVC